MKKVLFVLCLAVLLIGCAPVAEEPEEETGPDQELLAEIERVHNTPINDVDLSKVEDGTYEGAFGYHGVDYGVRVTVKDHKIESIEVIQTEEDEYAKMAEAVLDKVISEQKITVDATTGATTTSMAFLKAVEIALTG
ncbi:FMN-binding protein [Candidatus Woesearchaeota archaeon]|nr:FMN-binding protein [Candidatus Woesearchaeota archaeon]